MLGRSGPNARRAKKRYRQHVSRNCRDRRATVRRYPIGPIRRRGGPPPDEGFATQRAPRHTIDVLCPVFRIHRMKDAPRQQFRSAAHVSGAANVKPKDYEAARRRLRPIRIYQPGHCCAAQSDRSTWVTFWTSDNRLRICKYVGFEEARWFVPETPPQASLPAPF